MIYLYLDFEPPDLTNKLLRFLPLQEYKCDALTYKLPFFRLRDRFKNDARSYLESYAILFGEDGKAAPLGQFFPLGRNRVLEKKGVEGERPVRGAVVCNAGMLLWLATYPLVTTQDFGCSDIEKKNVDYGFTQRRFKNSTAGFGTK